MSVYTLQADKIRSTFRRVDANKRMMQNMKLKTFSLILHFVTVSPLILTATLLFWSVRMFFFLFCFVVFFEVLAKVPIWYETQHQSICWGLGTQSTHTYIATNTYHWPLNFLCSSFMVYHLMRKFALWCFGSTTCEPTDQRNRKVKVIHVVTVILMYRITVKSIAPLLKGDIWS